MKVCVFCSSKSELSENVFGRAREFSEKLVEAGDSFVYGGGAAGLMGFIADEVIKKGGETYGVIPEKAFPQEVAHQGLTKLYYTKDMLDRKKLMMDLADAFVIFPGGIGTMDEALEVMTWKTVYKFKKPIVFFNIDGFWNPFFDMLKVYQKTGLFYPETMTSYVVVDSVKKVLEECHA